MQEVAAILSKALPEYQWKAHGQGEKRQFCDNSKVWDRLAAAHLGGCMLNRLMLTSCASIVDGFSLR